jgi:hypothetical protein
MLKHQEGVCVRGMCVEYLITNINQFKRDNNYYYL